MDTFILSKSFNGNSIGLSGTPDINVRNIVGSGATFTGDVSIGGTLTYEDVTNVDVLGISTFANDVFFEGNYSGLDADAIEQKILDALKSNVVIPKTKKFN